MLRTLFAICFFSSISATTLAQQSVPTEFERCARIQKNSERLVCYDNAIAYLRQPTEQQTSAPSAEGSFGLQASVPQPPSAARVEGSKGDEVSSITARVTEMTSDREGKKAVTLDNGQTWREVTQSSFLALDVGDEVTINRAALGSFMMSVPNGRPIRVRRVK
jgi:hypothetical protein